jgi:DNA repair exonuclease SbcCD ATPase subunit
MAEISRTFPPAPASSKQSPARDPRRVSRQENSASTVPAIANVPIGPAPSAKPKSYGEKLAESLANLSSEASTATTLKIEYAKAKKAQIGINQHYEKLRNLSQFPAAKDLVGRIRESQNKDVISLKEQLNLRNQNQKNLTKRAAALVDAEAQSEITPTEALKDIQAESKYTKQSLQNLKNDLSKLTRDTREDLSRLGRDTREDLSKLTREFRESRTTTDRKTGELQHASNSQSDLLQTIKRRQANDFDSMKRTREQVDKAFSEIKSINERIKSLSYERSPATSRESPRQSVDQKTLSALEDRVKALESFKNQNNNATPEHGMLTKSVNQIVTRLEAIESGNHPVSGTTVQTHIPSSILEGRMANAEENIEAIKEIMEYKDKILCDDIEAKQKQMAQQLEETVGKIKAETASDLERAISEVKSSTPTKQEVVSSQGDTAQLYNERLESLTIACRSLESRYASVTAEALACQAIPIIRSQFPDPQLLHGVVGRFNVIEMHIAQLSRLRDLPQIVDSHSQHLSALEARTTQTRPNGEASTSNNYNSATLAEMQNNWQDVLQKIGDVQKNHAELKDLDSKLSSYMEENQQKHDQLRQTLDELNNEKDRVIRELTAMSGSIDELNIQTQAQKDEHTALTQSTSSRVQTVEQRLTARVKEIEDSIQHVEQKISETLSASGLEDAKSNLENFEVALQQHVESLTYQITQLEDKQKATALELSDLQGGRHQLDKFTEQQRAEDDEELKNTLEELAHRIDDLEDAKESIGRRFRDSHSPGSERSRSPSQFSNWSGGPSRDDDEENNIRAFNYNSRAPPGKKRGKRKFAKVSGPNFGSPRASFGGTPPRAPASMVERTGPPPFKKRQRSMMDLVDHAD